MKKQGFTLAEILISLMILGVIASLTIPSLIQNTTKKEQIVQLKKGLSMINQAITMNYALTGNDLSDEENNDTTKLVAMLKNRLSVVDSGDDWIRTQDGLTYYFDDTATSSRNEGCGQLNAEVVNADAAGNGSCFGVIISTKNSTDAKSSYTDAQTEAAGSAVGTLKGYYQFYAGSDRVVPTAKTQEIMNASDATKKEAAAGAGADSEKTESEKTESE